MNRSPLPAISQKKLATIAAAGLRLPWSTLAPVSAKRTATGLRGTYRASARDTGPDTATVELVGARDEGRCGWCGHPITGRRGWDWSASHRRPRRVGGDPRLDTNLASNLVLVHGHALSRCHFEIENERRGDAILNGHVLHADDVPSQRPIEHAVHGWCHLSDDGRVEQAPPPIDHGGVIDFGGYWNEVA